jgi:serine/threonine protein kinase
MKNGTLMEFMRSTKFDAVWDRNRLVSFSIWALVPDCLITHLQLKEIAKGIEYLHSLKMVHGDIRGVCATTNDVIYPFLIRAQDNILIDDNGHARVSDFGLIIVGHHSSGRCTTTHSMAGTIQFTSPERICAYADMCPPRRTFAEDIYAYGGLGIEVANSMSVLVSRLIGRVQQIVTGQLPFPGLSDTAVQFKIYRGEGPSRPPPERCLGHPMSDDLWKILDRCLSRVANDRPSASDILTQLTQQDIKPNTQEQLHIVATEGPRMLRTGSENQGASSAPPSHTRREGLDHAQELDDAHQTQKVKALFTHPDVTTFDQNARAGMSRVSETDAGLQTDSSVAVGKRKRGGSVVKSYVSSFFFDA